MKTGVGSTTTSWRLYRSSRLRRRLRVAYQLWLLQRLFVGRNDKSVRQTGLGFLVYLLLGALSGQGMLMAHSWELYRIE